MRELQHQLLMAQRKQSPMNGNGNVTHHSGENGSMHSMISRQDGGAAANGSVTIDMGESTLHVQPF